jgi:chromatin remodeling complex protein RSC6
MVRASKSVEKTAVTQSAPVETVAPVATETKQRVKKVKATEAPVVVAPVVPVETPAPVVAPVETTPLSQKLTEFSAKLQQLVGLFSTVKNDFKTLEKTVTREMKIAQKASSKKRRNNGNRKPSGFIKPTRISDELAAFLGKNVGTEMARTEVSKEINAYITTNDLQDKANGRKINPDDKLTKLLKLSKEDELTYFNLQRYMKHHFIKEQVLVQETA